AFSKSFFQIEQDFAVYLSIIACQTICAQTTHFKVTTANLIML
ncbi:hypothetical protein AAUPMB_06293, partial [Pasteurella multocida subsp. multocida str. Anand1_buffalo]